MAESLAAHANRAREEMELELSHTQRCETDSVSGVAKCIMRIVTVSGWLPIVPPRQM